MTTTLNRKKLEQAVETTHKMLLDKWDDAIKKAKAALASASATPKRQAKP